MVISYREGPLCLRNEELFVCQCQLLPELSEIVSRVADNMTQTNVSECLADMQIAFSSLVQDNFAQNRR